MNLANYSNEQALILFNLYNSLELCLEAIGRIHLGPKLMLTDDPVSADRMVVSRYQSGILTKEIHVQKQDVELATSNPMTRYQLLSYILNQFKDEHAA
ncbi:hypothetical protein B9T33_13975 [Acinetobacter sp. ANC 5054]|uniref:hypothetical protein n=1 Tax=Acinetobacter sp. ANC 5054 TaxID=1977877 RepID=UPI000A349389|nr:hypothetical protein [Acinetobacter sp. ANC 5054]OTG78430.1 hypothetical protein B9T33_13975 [Acinetobacter sp. ANC 5054]